MSPRVCILGVHSTWSYQETFWGVSASVVLGNRSIHPSPCPFFPDTSLRLGLLPHLPYLRGLFRSSFLPSRTHPDPSGICPRGGISRLEQRGKFRNAVLKEAANSGVFKTHTVVPKFRPLQL